jgi:hypothetical protein
MDATWAIAFTGLGLVLAVAGLIGCILPVIPGVPVSYLSLIILSLAKDWEPFSATFLVVMGGLTILTLVLDYAVPAIGARKVGASKWGIWGSILGMLIGLIFFPPFGLFIGGFTGAMAGELYAGKSGDQAFKAGLGVFVGNLLAIALKMGLCGVILYFYIKGMI